MPDAGAVDVVVRWEVAVGDAELATLALWDRGATAVGESPAGPGRARLDASYPTAAAAREVAAELAAEPARPPGPVAAVELDGSWRDAWRAHATPVTVAGGLVVAPAWVGPAGPGRTGGRDAPTGAGSPGVGSTAVGSTVLRIDPGPCFGSGSHPSTRLLLGLLATDPPVGADVLDLGTGSGILAVAAAVLGAASVVAVDVDPASPAVVTANAERHGVAHLVRASGTDAADLPPASVDLALVNVTAGVQVEVAGAAVAAVRPGGRLALAGMLPGQWRHVAGAYAGCELLAEPALDGWTGAVLRRP